MGAIKSDSFWYRRSTILLIIMFISFLLSGCLNERDVAKEIQIVQQSKTAYGTVYDLLIEFNGQRAINKIPRYGEVIERYLYDAEWASGKNDSGDVIVQVSGYMNYLGNYSEFIFEWIVKGDIEGDNAQVYYSAMTINGINPGNEVFDTISTLILNELGAINEKDLEFLGVFISLDNELY